MTTPNLHFGLGFSLLCRWVVLNLACEINNFLDFVVYLIVHYVVHEDLLYHLNNSSYQWQLIIHNNLIIVISYNSFKYLLKAIQSLIKNVNEDYDGLASIHLRILLIESFIKSHGTIKSLEDKDFHDEVFEIQAI